MIKLTIYETTDYDQFKQISSNREVNMKHVRELAADIQVINLLDVSPIICNERMEIIDGQHRLEAAKLLGLPIFYLIKKELTDDHIGHLNRNQKNWSVLDYITFYTLKKRPGFDVLSRFMRKHDLEWSIALMLLSGSQTTARKNVIAGTVNVSELDQAERVMGWVRELVPYGTFVRGSKFITALQAMDTEGAYDHTKVLRIVKKKHPLWKQQVKKAGYVDLLTKFSK